MILYRACGGEGLKFTSLIPYHTNTNTEYGVFMTASNETKKLYQLTQGNHFELDEKTGQQVERKAGDFIKLTEKQAHALRDKVKDADVLKLEERIKKEQAAAADKVRAEAEAEAAKAQAALEAEALDGEDEEDEDEDDQEEKTPVPAPAKPGAAKPAMPAKK